MEWWRLGRCDEGLGEKPKEYQIKIPARMAVMGRVEGYRSGGFGIVWGGWG